MRKQASNLKEQYYTDPDVAEALVKYFKKKEGLDKFKVVVEPSAGNGSFLKHLPSSFSKNNKVEVLAFDTYPKYKGIKKQDFLKWTFPSRFDDISPSRVLCIGNPPFGRQSTLAKKFLRKCSEFADHIAFILPISFNTTAFKKSIPDGFTKQWSVMLDENIFVDTKGYDFPQPLKTMFVYYKNTGNSFQARNSNIESNEVWQFKNKNDSRERNESDFRIIRASGTPGRAIHYKDPRFDISGNTYNDYYIEILSPYRRHVRDIVKDVNKYQQLGKWKFSNTTTFKSIDKNQVTRVLNKLTSKWITSH